MTTKATAVPGGTAPSLGIGDFPNSEEYPLVVSRDNVKRLFERVGLTLFAATGNL